ncbi:TetR/AcrR family transcriptional regulator [Bacillus canaveralius]|uniref:TetR/AcrR family transcriptional regulator n=1 Tax=Bacillus canaveralius TaxID=1403243 RepID=A0A2N5GQS4_9BACI|nr:MULTISPECIES: TetR/AcrR family transcriptional regulator [Bacillus]PLR85594.1 TetR/AcrR family transcriptional regulator [Bacillus canaveralius]PLR86433.1 TetR/AcrR family transcriptional regulator [Bacillus sp. V33-4]PLR94745.1 TetR/AcrR family transcriptional regulator [Bacillus canaveralius]RSK54719.1 TetR/AcrR family transcriptional regulator [Bacillus canaveralius]
MIDKKAAIFNSGRELFYSKGFKDTNVSDIAKMAGIGIGTFYNYYTSKEKLFLEIYLKENENLKKSIVESIDLNDDPVTLVTKLVKQNISAMNSNLILKEWYNRDLFSKLEQYFYEQGGIESIDELMHSGKAELIKKWKAERKIRDDLDDELIFALFNSILYIDIHKREIGIHHFPQILYYLTEFIMKGLTDCRK